MPSPYKDAVGLETVGWGHQITHSDDLTYPLTPEAGEELLLSDLRIASRDALDLSPVLATSSPKRLDAITSFIFNVGAHKYQDSTMRRKVNMKDWEAAADQMGLWVHAGKQILAGLVTRRAVEALWLRHG